MVGQQMQSSLCLHRTLKTNLGKIQLQKKVGEEEEVEERGKSGGGYK